MPSKEKINNSLDAVFEIARFFKQGRALTTSDIKDIFESKGLRRESAVNITHGMFKGERFMWETGVSVSAVAYRKRLIFYDASRDLETETDVSRVRREIDKQFETKRGNRSIEIKGLE